MLSEACLWLEFHLPLARAITANVFARVLSPGKVLQAGGWSNMPFKDTRTVCFGAIAYKYYRKGWISYTNRTTRTAA